MEGEEVKLLPVSEDYFDFVNSVFPDHEIFYFPQRRRSTALKSLGRKLSKCRQDPAYRERERIKNLERTRRLRENPEFRDRERIRNRISKQIARQDPIYREAERERNRNQKRRARENPTYREKERIKDMERKRWKRWGPAQPDEEWMEIGEVALDESALVALDQGLYRVVPQWDSVQESSTNDPDPEWIYPCLPTEYKFSPKQNSQELPRYSFDNHYSELPSPSYSSRAPVIIPQQNFSSQNLEGFSDGSKTFSTVYHVDSNLLETPNAQSKLTFVQKTEAPEKQIFSEPYSFYNLPPESVSAIKSDPESAIVMQSSRSEGKNSQDQIESPKSSLPLSIRKKLSNVDGIEIFPLSERTDLSLPHLNWQIEVVPIYKKKAAKNDWEVSDNSSHLKV